MANWNFAVCLLISAFVSGALGMDYSDLEFLGVSCPLRDSCAAMWNVTFFERNCECDRRCSFYGDCCIDAHRSPYRTRSAAQTMNATCMAFAGQDESGVYAFGKCRRDFSGAAAVRSRCEHPSDMSDPLVAAPATDTSTNVTYRSRYCAECNGVPPHLLVSWAIKVHCESLSSHNVSEDYVTSNLEYVSETDQWGIAHWNGSSSDFHSCDLIFFLPSSLEHSVRLCRANVVATCPRSWSRRSVERKCHSYTAVVAHSTTSLYGNPHCALCNGVDLDLITCGYGILSKNKQPMSFGMLLDVNQSDGEMVGVSRQASSTCPRGKKYDPYAKRCRSLVCALPGYVMVNGKCVRS